MTVNADVTYEIHYAVETYAGRVMTDLSSLPLTWAEAIETYDRWTTDLFIRDLTLVRVERTIVPRHPDA